MKGNLLLGLETSDSRMSRIAKNEIYFGRDVPLEEVARRRSTRSRNDDVVRVAQRLFRPGRARAHRARRPEGRAARRRGARGVTRRRCRSRWCACGPAPAPLPLPRYMSAGRGRAWTCWPTSSATSCSRRASAASCRPGSRSRSRRATRGRCGRGAASRCAPGSPC